MASDCLAGQNLRPKLEAESERLTPPPPPPLRRQRPEESLTKIITVFTPAVNYQPFFLAELELVSQLSFLVRLSEDAFRIVSAREKMNFQWYCPGL
jgi:hypothetical protein